MLHIFFGFSGRATRGQWWSVQLALVFLWVAVFICIAAIGSGQSTVATKAELGGGALLLVVGSLILSTWINVAISVKRLHDRDKSGWWFLMVFAPFVGGIWLLVACGCLAGTRGPNTYGSVEGSGSAEAYVDDMGSFNGSDIDDLIQTRLKQRQAASVAAKPAAVPILSQPAFGKRV